jgi:hypothetical protein
MRCTVKDRAWASEVSFKFQHKIQTAEESPPPRPDILPTVTVRFFFVPAQFIIAYDETIAYGCLDPRTKV